MEMSADENPALDAIDRKILGLVRTDGRISITRLADRIGLSTSATSERLRRLESEGVILGYRADISPDALARPVDAVIGVRAQSGIDRADIEAWIGRQPSVVEALHLTGPHDYVLRLRCTSTAELDDVLMDMKKTGGIADTETKIVLRRLPVAPAGP